MSKLVDFVSKNRSSIFVGGGLTSLIAGSVIGMIVTPTAVSKIKDAEKEKELTLWDRVKLTWKYYTIPATLMGGGTVLVLSGHCVDKKAQSALAAAVGMSEAALGQYKDEVKKLIGEEKEKEVQKKVDDKVVEKKLANTNGFDVYETGHGKYLCYDTLTGRFFHSSKEWIMSAVNECNKDMIDSAGYCSLNELYYRIGLPDVGAGDIFGFNVDGLIDVNMSEYGPGINGEPCLMVDVKKNMITDY